MVIWVGRRGTGQGITDNDVNIFERLHAVGKPLYLIGENLASDLLELSPNAKDKWLKLIRLKASGQPMSKVGIKFPPEQELQTKHPILHGRYGDVKDFDYTGSVDETKLYARPRK